VSDVEILGWTLLVVGISCVPLGIVFSLLPMIPGPPVSAAAPAAVLGGMHFLGHPAPAWIWFIAIVLALVGLLVALIDLLSPVIGKRLGRTSRGAMIGSYFGLAIAVLLSLQMGGLASVTAPLTVGLGLVAGTWAGAVLVVLGPLLGGFVGELAAMPRPGTTTPSKLVPVLEQATIAGLSQGGGLLVTTGAKVIYGLVVGLAVVAMAAVVYLG
jgi:uncharacterized protein